MKRIFSCCYNLKHCNHFQVRPTAGPGRKDGNKSTAHNSSKLLRHSNRPPKGMYVNHDDLVALATGPPSQGEALLKSMEREIVSYKRVVG